VKKAIFISLGFFLTSYLSGQQFPFKNHSLSSQERAKDLISRLTLAEKAALMCDQSDAILRLGVKKFNW
jgi:beta-glucosidase